MPSVDILNNILKDRLGMTPYGDPLFKWEWSEDLFWPAYATGKMEESVSASGLILCQTEYRKERMTHKYRRQWLITKWLAPDDLVSWNARFPGAEYPSRGWRMFTNAALPQGVVPDYSYTEHFIECVKPQMAPREKDILDAWEKENSHADNMQQRRLEDAIGDQFTAFLKIKPGARGEHVSFGGIGESPILQRSST